MANGGVKYVSHWRNEVSAMFEVAVLFSHHPLQTQQSRGDGWAYLCFGRRLIRLHQMLMLWFLFCVSCPIRPWMVSPQYPTVTSLHVHVQQLKKTSCECFLNVEVDWGFPAGLHPPPNWAVKRKKTMSRSEEKEQLNLSSLYSFQELGPESGSEILYWSPGWNWIKWYIRV